MYIYEFPNVASTSSKNSDCNVFELNRLAMARNFEGALFGRSCQKKNILGQKLP
jgi:hypothetical protein